MHNKSIITLLFFIHFISNPLFGTETRNTPHNPSSINMAPSLDYRPSIAPACNIENKPQFINYVYSLSYAIGMKIRDISLTCMDEIYKNATRQNYQFVKQLIKEMLWYYRYRIVGSTMIGSYSITSILLISDYHYLRHNTTWATWKKECTFEDLCAISQKDLARELLLAIGQHYYSEKNPIDLTHPLIQFLNAIDTEIKTIKRYLNTAKFIKQLHLTKLFPVNDNKINIALKLLERALFIKHIFLSWLSEYNLINNKY